MMNKTNHNSPRLNLANYVFRPEFSSLVILIAMVVITAVLQENFFTIKSIVRNINAFAPLILLAMGAGVVIISGGLDLSAGAALSLFTCVLTTVMKRGEPITGVYAIIITFAVAIMVGVVNGIGIGYLRIPPVIVTFATSYIWLGIGLFLRPTPGGESVAWFRMFYNPAMVDGIHPAIEQFGRVIPPALILVLIACFIWFIVSKTKTGRYIYAVGSNNDNAYASGINTAKVQLLACVINSIFIFLAALFFVGQNQSGDARMGDPLTLRAIASAIVGGIALTGGRGSVYFALVGALILSFVNKIIFFANISYAYQTLVSGLIVIVAIAAPVAYNLHSSKED
ncbi:MAG: ribose transport system permease protein [Candidatus Atribacteria bacterium]|nr:ribose transport system permease protein [Candidatus Atribacteria bacterium]